jgi:hypothetical protein
MTPRVKNFNIEKIMKTRSMLSKVFVVLLVMIREVETCSGYWLPLKRCVKFYFTNVLMESSGLRIWWYRCLSIANPYYPFLSITLFPAGGECCLGRHVLSHMCHLQVTTVLSCT